MRLAGDGPDVMLVITFARPGEDPVKAVAAGGAFCDLSEESNVIQ